MLLLVNFYLRGGGVQVHPPAYRPVLFMFHTDQAAIQFACMHPLSTVDQLYATCILLFNGLSFVNGSVWYWLVTVIQCQICKYSKVFNS